MIIKQTIERSVSSIITMGKTDLKKRIRNFNGNFELDFTDDYLDEASVDSLRHILLSAIIHAKAIN